MRTELKRHLLKYSVFGCMVLGLHLREKCCGVGAGMRAVACAVVGAVARCWCVSAGGFKPAAPPPLPGCCARRFNQNCRNGVGRFAGGCYLRHRGQAKQGCCGAASVQKFKKSSKRDMGKESLFFFDASFIRRAVYSAQFAPGAVYSVKEWCIRS